MSRGGKESTAFVLGCNQGQSYLSSALTVLSHPQRLYRLGDADSLHRYTPIADHPDFTRARLNAMHLSDVSSSKPACGLHACFRNTSSPQEIY